MSIVAMSIALLDQRTYNFKRRFHLSNHALMGKIKKKISSVDVNKTVGLETVSTKCLNPSIVTPVLKYLRLYESARNGWP